MSEPTSPNHIFSILLNIDICEQTTFREWNERFPRVNDCLAAMSDSLWRYYKLKHEDTELKKFKAAIEGDRGIRVLLDDLVKGLSGLSDTQRCLLFDNWWFHLIPVDPDALYYKTQYLDGRIKDLKIGQTHSDWDDDLYHPERDHENGLIGADRMNALIDSLESKFKSEVDKIKASDSDPLNKRDQLRGACKAFASVLAKLKNEFLEMRAYANDVRKLAGHDPFVILTALKSALDVASKDQIFNRQDHRREFIESLIEIIRNTGVHFDHAPTKEYFYNLASDIIQKTTGIDDKTSSIKAMMNDKERHPLLMAMLENAIKASSARE